MHLIPMHLIQFWVPGYELPSHEDEPPLQPDDAADGGSALDDMQRHCSLKLGRPTAPILQPAQIPFDFAAFCSDQSEIQPHCWLQYETLMHICHLDPSLYIQ